MKNNFGKSNLFNNNKRQNDNIFMTCFTFKKQKINNRRHIMGKQKAKITINNLMQILY